jgi:hypothetical protein
MLQRATLSGQRVPPQLGNLTNNRQNPGIRCAVNVMTRVICDEPTVSKRGSSGGGHRVTSRPLFDTTSRVRKGQTIGAIRRLERSHVRGRRGSSPTRRAKLKRQEQYALAEPGCLLRTMTILLSSVQPIARERRMVVVRSYRRCQRRSPPADTARSAHGPASGRGSRVSPGLDTKE